MATFPAPATSNAACGFPALYVLEHIKCVMWPSELCGACVAEAYSPLAHNGRAPHNSFGYRLDLTRTLVEEIQLCLSSSSRIAVCSLGIEKLPWLKNASATWPRALPSVSRLIHSGTWHKPCASSPILLHSPPTALSLHGPSIWRLNGGCNRNSTGSMGRTDRDPGGVSSVSP